MNGSWKRIAVVGGAAAFTALLGWVFFTRGPLAPPKVETVRVERGELQPGIFGVGTIEARRSYTVGPTQAGRVLSILVDQGQFVKAGQVLAKMDPVDLEQRIQSAGTAREQSLNAVRIAEAQVRQAITRNNLAAATAGRYNQLAANQAASKETVEVKQSEADIAQAALESAQLAFQAAGQDSEKAGFELEALQMQLDKLTLVAPADGVVIARDAEPGNALVAGQPVLRIVDPASLWVRVRIDQGHSQGISVGQPAGIILRTNQEKVIPGVVARVEILSDSIAEERVANVTFKETPPNLSPGELAEVTIALPPVPDALAVPSAAVKRLNRQYGVWRLEDGKARFFPVQVGVHTLDGRTQILDGLREGDPVVAYSPVEIHEGLRVRVGIEP